MLYNASVAEASLQSSIVCLFFFTIPEVNDPELDCATHLTDTKTLLMQPDLYIYMHARAHFKPSVSCHLELPSFIKQE